MKLINSGVGDMFISRVIMDHYNNEIPVTYSLNGHIGARGNNKAAAEFVTKLANKLFKKVTPNHPIKDTSKAFLYHKFNKKKPLNVKSHFNLNHPKEDYIVIHTKVRADYDVDKLDSISKSLGQFFSSHKFNCSKVIIMGERVMSENFETIQHKQRTFYKAIQSLSENNIIEDRTKQELYNTSVFEDFLEDLEIMHKAKLNIGFGWGGNFAMTWGVCDNFIQWIGNCAGPFIEEIKSRNCQERMCIDSIDLFIDEIKKQ